MLGHISSQLEQRGHNLKGFNERLKVYRQRRQELESDPAAPQGLPKFIGRTLTKAGVHLARRAPGVGVAFEFVDEDALATQAGDWMTYIAQKISNKDEVRLIQDPVEVLTPLFLEELHKIAEKETVAFFFDTYERTAEYLDDWLRGLLDGQFGDVPANLIISIAGQHELDKNRWAPYEELIARLPLEPFSEEEALDYLARKGITDDKLVQIIIKLSGRLPLLVATLASESPENPNDLGDPSGTAVERFLKWVADPQRRQVAKDAALPRQLNRDVLAIIVGEEDADVLFTWLKSMPFVDNKRWNYHGVVRSQMLRHVYRESPQHWADLHGKFVSFYDDLRNGLDINEGRKELNGTWQAYALNSLYHNLCKAPHKETVNALNGFISALNTSGKYATRWAESIEQAGNDIDSTELTGWGKKLKELVKAGREKRYDYLLETLSELLSVNNLEHKWRASVLVRRSDAHQAKGLLTEAIQDLTSAIQLDSQVSEYWLYRSDLYIRAEDYKRAMADLNHLIERDVSYVQAISVRGEVHRLTGKYKLALTDFNKALELDPNHAHTVFQLGIAYRQLKQFEEALDAFNRYIEIENKPKSEHRAWREIGSTLQAWGKHEQAMNAYLSALSVNPICNGCWRSLAHLYRTLFPLNDIPKKLLSVELPDGDKPAVRLCRGEGLRSIGFVKEAIDEFDSVIALGGDHVVKALYYRAFTYNMLGRYDEALTDCNSALTLAPDDGVILSLRGEISMTSSRPEDALEDLKQAVQLKPDLEHVAQKNMGLSLHALRKYNQASRAFIKALAAQPECIECWVSLGKTYQKVYSSDKTPKQLRNVSVTKSNKPAVILCRAAALGRLGYFKEALDEYDKVIKLGANVEKALMGRGRLNLNNKQYSNAINDFTQVIEIATSNEDIAWSLAMRAKVFYEDKRLEEALVDINRAIELEPSNVSYIVRRGEVYQWIGQYENALADYEYVDSLNNVSDKDWDKGNSLGLVLSYLGRYAEAIENYEQALSSEHDSYTALYNIAVAKVRWQGLSGAPHDIEVARDKLTLLLNDPDTRGNSFYGLGGLEAVSGNAKVALDYLEQAIPLCYEAVRWARHDIAWNGLRADIRFQQLLKQGDSDL